jgi:hypothetical protein
VVGLLGVFYGAWARSHPKRSQLVSRIAESALMPEADPENEVRVTQNGVLVPEPYVVIIDLTNLGPDELSPSSFDGGHLRFTTKRYTSSNVPMGVTFTQLAVLRADSPVKIEYPSKDRVSLALLPCQLKVGESISIACLISGEPQFESEGRLTGFAVREMRGAGPSEFELRIDLPGSLGTIPVTWTRHRPSRRAPRT